MRLMRKCLNYSWFNYSRFEIKFQVEASPGFCIASELIVWIFSMIDFFYILANVPKFSGEWNLVNYRLKNK